jgi:undecaprenyl-diphosphatase
MVAGLAQHILALPALLVVLLAFGLPALESAAFFGFVFPGETALILGGVIASQHRVPVAAVIAAGILGAVLGDSVGYAVGRRYGRRLLDGRLGRLVKADHRVRAERYLAERGGKAVFLGRFTAALRVMVPGLAGIARMPYRTFLASNAAGGVGWVVMSVLLGYFAGSSWQYAAHVASGIGLVALGLLVLSLVAAAVVRRVRRARDARRPTVGTPRVRVLSPPAPPGEPEP